MLRSMPTGPAGPRTVEGPFGNEIQKTCFLGTIFGFILVFMRWTHLRFLVWVALYGFSFSERTVEMKQESLGPVGCKNVFGTSQYAFSHFSANFVQNGCFKESF